MNLIKTSSTLQEGARVTLLRKVSL